MTTGYQDTSTATQNYDHDDTTGYQGTPTTSQSNGTTGYQDTSTASQSNGTTGYQDTPTTSQSNVATGYQDTSTATQNYDTTGYQGTPTTSQSNGATGYQDTSTATQNYDTTGYQDTPTTSQSNGATGYQDTSTAAQNMTDMNNRENGASDQSQYTPSLRSVTIQIQEDLTNISILNVCGKDLPYGFYQDEVYFSTSECFTAMGINKHVLKQGFSQLLRILNNFPCENNGIFVRHHKSRWIRLDALKMLLKDRRTYKRYQRQKDVILHSIEKSKFVNEPQQIPTNQKKPRRNLLESYSMEPINEAAMSPSQPVFENDSDSNTGDCDQRQQQNVDTPFTESNTNELEEIQQEIQESGRLQESSVSNDQEGQCKMTLLGKSVKCKVLNNQIFVSLKPLSDDIGLKKHISNYGYTHIDYHLRNIGFQEEKSFLYSSKQRSHILLFALLKLCSVISFGYKDKLKQLKDDLVIGLEVLACAQTNSNTNTSLENLINNHYNGDKKEFLNDVSRAFSKERVANTKEPLFTKDHFMYLIRDTKNRDLFMECMIKAYKEAHPLSGKDIVYYEVNYSGTRLMEALRKKIPGIFPSQREERDAKKRFDKAFKAVMLPRRISTGWFINPSRLLQVLMFRYPFLAEELSIKICGDGREYGGRHSVFLALALVNNELMLNGISYQSPKELFEVALFYESDNRDNLEMNLTKPNFLEHFVKTEMEKEGGTCRFYLTGDEMFNQAMLDASGELNPLSSTGWNLYREVTHDQKGNVGDSGLRTDLPAVINRSHPDAIIPSIKAEYIRWCILHGFARSIEKLLNLVIEDILSEKSKLTEKNGSLTGEDLIQNLESNINARGIKQGNFKVIFDKSGKPEPVSLSKDSAMAIAAPVPESQAKKVPHVLKNVILERQVVCPLNSNMSKLLKIPTEWTEFQYVSHIWSCLFQMFKMLKKEPEPKLKDGAPLGSALPEDYTWGYSVEDRLKYKQLAECFYQLFKARYGAKNLTPYMMKFVDYPFTEPTHIPLCRFQAEGAEHLNYEHNVYYHSHTTRHGGKNNTEPLLGVFRNTWIRICYEIEHSEDKEAAEHFSKFVRKHSSASYLQCRVKGHMLRKKLIDNPKSTEEIEHNKSVMFEESRPDGNTKSKSNINLKLFSDLNFILVGSVPKDPHGEKCTQEQIEKMIKDNGGFVRKSIPGKSKGRSAKKYIILLSNNGTRQKYPKIVKSAIAQRFDIVSYQFIFDSVRNPQHLSPKQYLVDIAAISAKITRAPSVQSKHFSRKRRFLSVIKTPKKKRKKTSPVKCPRNAAVGYAIQKRKQEQTGVKMTFSESVKCYNKYLKQWKSLPKDSSDRLTFHQKWMNQKAKKNEKVRKRNELQKYNKRALPRYLRDNN